MAPLLSLNNLDNSTDWNITTVSRENIALGNGTAFSLEQEHTFRSLAVTFASFSLACSVVTSYWFLRMRRSYRHDLIMLLIQSDSWKALWLMMYPIVVFVHGPVSNKSAFCQVNGFMFSLGVEASDFAVLMIAVHSLLNIFKRNPSSTGLYRYRYIAYFFWIAFPVTMASIAFLNDDNAYVESITYCYLPVRPFWYRLALSWIPRYCIFIIILIIYASIYFYVRFRFESFQRASHSDQSTTVAGSINFAPVNEPKKKRRFSLPATPKLMLHGLVPGSRSRSLGSKSTSSTGTSEDWKRSSASTVYSNPREGNPGYLSWMAYLPRDSKELSSGSRSQVAPPNTESTQSFGSLPEQEAGTNTNEALLTYPNPTHPRRGTSERLSISYDLVLSQRLPSMAPTSRSQSFFTMIAALRTRPTNTTASDSTPISQLELVDSNGDNIALNTVTATREKIRRQLRLLFIYPLVYMGMWFVPFIFHIMQFSRHYALHPPFGLTCLVTVILAMQCAVDCLLFCSREKPWKHIPSTNGGLLESFKFWDLKANRRGSNLSAAGRAGMTREEMVMQARRAYRRREQEIAARSAQARESVGRPERSWWDEGFDGATPPAVNEEIEQWDPLDQRGVRIPETVPEADVNEGPKDGEV